MLNDLKISSPCKVLSQLLTCGLWVVVTTSCACTDTRQPEVQNKKEREEIADAGVLSDMEVKQAIAHVKPLQEDQIKGLVVFTKVPEGIKIEADVEGLKPGEHGFHVHEFGDCSLHGDAAGAHFNPTHSEHGGPDSEVRHVGDLGNLMANEEGRAHYERIDRMITLDGENSILGRSLIIHADPDDYKTQPTGASGARIACGVIEVFKK
jgi:superoxide dismutase, Cu-Zn family